MSALTDAIKANVDIVEVASRYVSLKKSWSNYVWLSPFKKERSPSFVISPQKQIFKCFSTGLGWNVITLVIELEKVDFIDAIKILAEIGNVKLDDYFDNTNYDKDHNAKKEWLKRINKLLLDFSTKHLTWSKAETYIVEKRKLSSDIISKFGLWYVPDSYDEMVEYFHKQWFKDEELLTWSVAKQWEKSVFSFFRNRLMFPIVDQMDNVIWFGARALEDDQMPKYLNTWDTLLYDKSRVLYWINFVKKNVREYKFVIVVEWYMDVIALHQAWFPVAVATCGTSLTSHHIQMLQRYTNDVLFLFDNDEAGLNATIRWLKLAYERNVFPRMITVEGDNKDIDDVVRKSAEEAHEIVKKMIENAQDGFEWVYKNLSTILDDSPVQQQKLLAKMFDLLQAIDSLTVQMHYIWFLSNEVWINEEYLKVQYTQYVKNGKKKTKTWTDPQEEEKEGYRPKKAFLLGALLYEDFVDAFFDDLWKRETIKKLLSYIAKYEDTELFSLIINKKELTEEDQKLLAEEQLWREHEFATLEGDAIKYKFLKNILLDEINRVAKTILKVWSLDVEAKQEILVLLRAASV